MSERLSEEEIRGLQYDARRGAAARAGAYDAEAVVSLCDEVLELRGRESRAAAIGMGAEQLVQWWGDRGGRGVSWPLSQLILNLRNALELSPPGIVEVRDWSSDVEQARKAEAALVAQFKSDGMTPEEMEAQARIWRDMQKLTPSGVGEAFDMLWRELARVRRGLRELGSSGLPFRSCCASIWGRRHLPDCQGSAKARETSQ